MFLFRFISDIDRQCLNRAGFDLHGRTTIAFPWFWKPSPKKKAVRVNEFTVNIPAELSVRTYEITIVFTADWAIVISYSINEETTRGES